MTAKELTTALTYLGTAYGKEYKQVELELHYDFLGGYNYNTLVEAIKTIIKRSRYLPRINELIDECEQAKLNDRVKILETARLNNIITEQEYNKIKYEVRAGYIRPQFKPKFDMAYKQLGLTTIEHKSKALKEG